MTKHVAGRTTGRPDREELRELYKAAQEEYRFQVQLNWSRSQYLLAFNAAIIAAGTGLIKVGTSYGNLLTAGVFLVGAVAAILSIFATRVQHGYYRTARDRMRRLEDQLHLRKEVRLDTTPGMGGPVRRFGRVTTILYTLFALIAFLDGVGATYATTFGHPR